MPTVRARARRTSRKGSAGAISLVLCLVATALLAARAPAMDTWQPVAPLSGARGDHTATLLSDGRVLVAGGAAGPALSTAESFDPTTGAWSSTTNGMSAARSNHTATLLADGRVLVAGGVNGPALDSSELFNPGFEIWTGTPGSLGTARSGHTATLLADGRVLVAGGISDSLVLASSELYDPATGTWSETAGGLYASRFGHTATLLQDGRVLVAGGTVTDEPAAPSGRGPIDISKGSLNGCEIFDPASGTWSATGSLAAARARHSATALPDGRVLAAGGVGAELLDSSEIYDPATGIWTATAGSLAKAREVHSASLLPDGRVLVAGGLGDSALSTSETFDPATDSWSTTPGSFANARSGQSATLLAGGRVLAVGGFNSLAAAVGDGELFDAAAPAVAASGNLVVARRQHRATYLADGRLLMSGGNRPAIDGAEIYDPATGDSAATASMATPRRLHAANLLPDGRVLVTGGTGTDGRPVGTVELYSSATGSWATTAALAPARTAHAGELLADGRVLVAGGSDEGPGGNARDLEIAEIFDPTGESWISTGNLSTARTIAMSVLLSDGRVMLAGGLARDVAIRSVEIWDPATGAWSSTGNLATPRILGTLTGLADGRVLLVGGANQTSQGFVVLDSAEIWDPATGSWSATGDLVAGRFDHSATPFPDGRVLIAGGFVDFLSSGSLEIFDPLGDGGSGAFVAAPALTEGRAQHTASLLPDGRLLIAGGTDSVNRPLALHLARSHEPTLSGSFAEKLGRAPLAPLASLEIVDPGLAFDPAGRPVILKATPVLGDGDRIAITGSGFRGAGEASGGNGSQSSPSDHPVAQLRSLESQRLHRLAVDPAFAWSDGSFTSLPISGLPRGHYFLTVFVNGVPSVAATTRR